MTTIIRKQNEVQQHRANSINEIPEGHSQVGRPSRRRAADIKMDVKDRVCVCVCVCVCVRVWTGCI
jgi:hypothetical protein